MAPIFSKLRAFPYRQFLSLALALSLSRTRSLSLSPKESTALRLWTVARDRVKSRIATPKPKLTDRAAYTDAWGGSRIS